MFGSCVQSFQFCERYLLNLGMSDVPFKDCYIPIVFRCPISIFLFISHRSQQQEEGRMVALLKRAATV